MVALLEEIQENKNWRETFPLGALEGCESGLLLFCAAKLGAYDGVRLVEAGMQDVTAVDMHRGYLRDMRSLYPREWKFVEADAWEFADAAARTWDFVSVDPPTNLAGRVSDDLALWASLAKHSLIVGIHDPVDPPQGFELVEQRQRSQHEGGWYWLSFRRL